MKLKKSFLNEAQKLKLLQNLITQIVIKLKNSNNDKTQIVTKLNNLKCDKTRKFKF